MHAPASLTQQLLARASNREHVAIGEIVTCDIGLAMMHDSSGPRRVVSKLAELEAAVWDPDRVVLVSDHFVPAIDNEAAGILDFTRRWAQHNGIGRFHDGEGICHVLLAERGYLAPGLVGVGGDSHTPTAGAFGAFMVGIGATEMAGVLTTGKIWLRIPATIQINCTGTWPKGVVAKDLILSLCAQLGMHNDYRVVEYAGPAIAELPMAERMTLCNMAAELGAKTALIAPDNRTFKELKQLNVELEPWQQQLRPSANSSCERSVAIDVAALVPQVAAPHSPANSTEIATALGTKINQAYIGACTGAKESDLRMVAEILRGRQVATRTRLLIAPASVAVTAQLAADGTLATILQSGAQLLPTGCGACAGLGAGMLAAGEVGIASTARNFRGRMGDARSETWLASPYSVAAAAVTGQITDPRELLA